MESVIKQLVKIGHGMGAEVEKDEPAVAKLLVELSSALDVQYERANALEANCAALAAELSAVEAIHNDAVFVTDDHYEQCPKEVQKIIRSLAVMQIPAYKAFLAEVRAQGVDMMVDQCESDIVFIEPEDEEHHTLMIERAKEFAAQLRKGVQS